MYFVYNCAFTSREFVLDDDLAQLTVSSFTLLLARSIRNKFDTGCGVSSMSRIRKCDRVLMFLVERAERSAKTHIKTRSRMQTAIQIAL